MIFTVTLNPAVDKTVEVPSFTVDAVNRIVRIRQDPGGKGINVSKVIERLGGDSVAFAVLGGDTGARIREMLSGFRFGLVCIRTDGATRTNMKIVDPVLHTNTDINEPGSPIGEGVIGELKRELEQRLRENDILVLSGSVPAGAGTDIYRQLTETGRRFGAKVFLDADGPLFEQGIEAAPFLVKPNRYELEQYVGRKLETTEALVEAGNRLLAKGVRAALISLGGDGAVLCMDGECLAADGLSVPVGSTVGAGDAMTAAFAYATDRGMNGEDAFRLSVAAGSAAVTCSGSQPPDAELVRELCRRVKIRRLGSADR